MTVESLMVAMQQYFFLCIFVIAAYGVVLPLSAWMQESHGISRSLQIPLQITAGVGVFIVLLTGAGSVGQLNRLIVTIFLLIGLTIVGTKLALQRKAFFTRPQRFSLLLKSSTTSGRWWVAVLTILALPYLFIPLQIPLEWDEIMYHIPYAHHWANLGSLGVNEWLRYPLFPYNMNLLYAASLLFENDILPHLIHAFSGALTCFLTFSIGKRFFSGSVGFIAALIVFRSTNGAWEAAYVDLGLMLFWSAAFAALALRYSTKDYRFSYMAAFYAAIAVGVKYQALAFMPVFLLLAFVVERRPLVVLKSTVIFILFGGFWYVRNWMISGDPISPLGGEVFGYWIWSSADLVAQAGDIERVRDWPDWYLLLSVGSILFWKSSSGLQRALVLVTLGSCFIWYSFFGYARYLIPIYPMMGLLSGMFLSNCWSSLGLQHKMPEIGKVIAPLVRNVGFTFLVIAAMAYSFGELEDASVNIAWTQEKRHSILQAEFSGYTLLSSLTDTVERPMYQLGFENEIYYLGGDVRGDVFGRGRYSDVFVLTDDAVALSNHLRGLEVKTMLVNKSREPFSAITWDPEMLEYFEVVASTDNAILYRLVEN